MRLIFDKTTDPQWNLAAEEFLLENTEEPLLRIWRNDRSIIVGRNQNAAAEISSDYVNRNNIPVVRRLSGGGAVFHDLGNINYSFFNVDKNDALEMIVGALRAIGLDAECSGRNDILLDGHKVSGTAGCRQCGHSLFHGTLLYDACISDMVEALKPRSEKFEGKAVKSVRARVGNIRDLCALDYGVEEFVGILANNLVGAGEEYFYSDEDLVAVRILKDEKYSTDEWNFGKSPDYNYSAVKKFPGGLVEIYLKIKGGVIESAEVRGDYFFERTSEEFCASLKGCSLSRKKIFDRLNEETVEQTFCGITPEELMSLFP